MPSLDVDHVKQFDQVNVGQIRQSLVLPGDELGLVEATLDVRAGAGRFDALPAHALDLPRGLKFAVEVGPGPSLGARASARPHRIVALPSFVARLFHGEKLLVAGLAFGVADPPHLSLGPDEPAGAWPALAQDQVALRGVVVVVELVRILGTRRTYQRLGHDVAGDLNPRGLVVVRPP
ncbi:hypothetical protein MTX26_30665 [Bradyrhizobium sp. ISRA443]|uniref:hypothetical protein n=1 Tax=unclassified Bradyrhizobium TaxID=2631580 RepID=UPI00247A10BB|nr:MULTISPECIES: hypothetical protein [unclassified Bradyrhizobium]WGR98541.1 hypothetical protein MTX23_30650 [Bradyrhizobium sp. ISRA436]WGS05430.1 hypothetical protein MTX18_30670 [Bradyrhizobium sp. ISRA437]WGS12316.1 hypothetical protein MTX26_30665 [Bradyrhizobium sp. ISRA443]